MLVPKYLKINLAESALLHLWLPENRILPGIIGYILLKEAHFTITYKINNIEIY